MRPAVRGLVLAAATLLRCAVVGGAPPAGAQPSTHPTRILLIYGSPPEAPATAAFTRRLRTTVRTGVAAHVEFYEEYLDFDRFPRPQREEQLVGYLAEKYRSLRPDAVVAVGEGALRFVEGRVGGLLHEVPVLFALVRSSGVDLRALPAHETGRLMSVPFAATLALARRLQPDAERAVIVAGPARVASIVAGDALAAIAGARGRLPAVVLRGRSLRDLHAALGRLSPRTIVLLVEYRRDSEGLEYFPTDVVAGVAQASRAPVYGAMRHWVGAGIVGGATIDIEDEGARTGRLLLRVLARRAGEPLPPVEAAGATPVVDWRALQRWRLPEGALPRDTEVRFQTPTTWARYRTMLLATAAVLVAQSTLIALLLVERRRRLAAQHAVEEQAAFEQTIAELTADAVRHAPDEGQGALEAALARIGRLARASGAELVQYADGPAWPERRLRWTNATLAPPATANGQARLEIPLVVDDRPVGALALHRAGGRPWSRRMVARVEAAGELVAGALARARAVQAIVREEELNRAVLASLSTQIAILDRDGRIVRVNEAWRATAQRGAVDVVHDAFLGVSYLDECRRAEARGCDEAGAVRRGIEAVLAGERAAFRHHYHCLPPDERWYELSVDRLDHADGGAVVTHLDVSDRHLADLRADEARRQLAHMGRVATIGELAAAISHDVKQPLAAIRANATAGAILSAREPAQTPDGWAGRQEAWQIFTDIAVDVKRATGIIDNIRMLLRKERSGPAAVDLGEICEAAASLLRRDAAQRGVQVTLALAPGLPSVHGDPVELQQVVLNLLSNAIDATTSVHGTRPVVVATAVRDRSVELTVRDSGPGLSAEVQPRLFESFFTTKEHGLGLGLVIVRSIVERHGGRVCAENDPDGGAVFRVVLPTPPLD